ncbi:thioesterase superfamily protein [Yamadazyma tenuis]|uniref:Thioesterase domain-containing protein n=1 Tax=Candida tenuis (strain ATCC 10573 / BCRC 21748 / CBS 615 / JCM 9827 / NBRC 10315 / NRRL Y-1498 / VKM Y-70) TaxID=590646 RepID=G3B4F6_CANTC|nr:uncharacterized protein CANTEDRAFT_104937 [Yamadazyma tenuis ATCC 10573]EGV63813.1 hypothetical protein CANTEDRAFT_104937 [Yamadazyma tenuis ATCC 10573]WEJ96578.1 thioesterase superfamily protein [Yamadazyma tenuis]
MVGETSKYEEHIHSLAVYQELLEQHKAFNLSRLIEENLRPNLTGDTLIGDDKINYRGNGIFFIDDAFLQEYDDIDEVKDGESNFLVTFFHLGSKLSGHNGIVHGGLLATLLDELTCRLAFQNFHSKKGVTANLNINYKKPCFVNSVVMIKCELSRKSGRKCWVKGSVFSVKDSELELLTECECLVIEPRWVKNL